MYSLQFLVLYIQNRASKVYDHVEEVLKSRISVFDLSAPRDTNHARHKGHGSPRISHARIMKIPLDDVICIPDCRLLHDFK